MEHLETAHEFMIEIIKEALQHQHYSVSCDIGFDAAFKTEVTVLFMRRGMFANAIHRISDAYAAKHQVMAKTGFYIDEQAELILALCRNKQLSVRYAKEYLGKTSYEAELDFCDELQELTEWELANLGPNMPTEYMEVHLHSRKIINGFAFEVGVYAPRTRSYNPCQDIQLIMPISAMKVEDESMQNIVRQTAIKSLATSIYKDPKLDHGEN